MSCFEGYKDDEVLEMCRDDWTSAEESRQELEDHKLGLYRLYRTFRKDLPRDPSGRPIGPFGWSSLEVPLVFWIVETIFPRVGIQLPTVTVKPRNAAAVPYARAKQLRLQRQWENARIEDELTLAIKSSLILGEGYIKDFWDPILRGPSARYTSWFDIFTSPEAERFESAEVIYHRTWHTARGLKDLLKRDGKRKDPETGKPDPLYDHEALEQVINGARTRDGGEDQAWQEIREAAGLGTATYTNDGGQVALVECHYLDGSMAVISGDKQPLLLRRVDEPMNVDPHGRAWRPFTCISNTPDLFTPYAISDAEMLEDSQREISTITNQTIDQATRNINAPRGVDDTMVDDVQEVISAFGRPGGVFRTKGPPNQAVTTFPPGQLSGDFERMTDKIQQWSQQTSGVSDVVAGIQTPGGMSNDTATGANILREEGNMRYRIKIKMIGRGIDTLVRHFHWRDVSVSQTSIQAPADRDFQVNPGELGMRPAIMPPGIKDPWVTIDPEVNGAQLEYDVAVEAGSLSPPSQTEQAQKARALAADMAAFPPGSVTVNWQELAKRMIQAADEDPETILLPAPPQPMGAPAGMPPAPEGGPPPPAQLPTPEPAAANGAGPPQ